MERCAELEAVNRRWLEALGAGDADSVVAPLSGSPHVLWVGTDPGEEWWGREQIAAIIRRQVAELRGSFTFRLLDIFGWSEGSVGWTYSTVELEIQSHPIHMRFTSVYHLEHAQWRVVHVMAAVAVPNEEAIGMQLTTSVDLVAQAVEVERPDLGGAAAPDGTVTLLFTDIEGSTERNSVLGDRAWMALLRQHHELVRQQVSSNGGFEVKSMGDGFMIAFSSARRALQCAMDIQHSVEKDPTLDIRIRAGLHAGETVRVGDDFYGGVVNMAARVAGSAAGGEILVSGLVKALVDTSGDFAFDQPRSVRLKGIAGEHQLHPVRI